MAVVLRTFLDADSIVLSLGEFNVRLRRTSTKLSFNTERVQRDEASIACWIIMRYSSETNGRMIISCLDKNETGKQV